MFVAIVKSSKFNSLAQNHKYASKGFTIFTAYGTNHMLRPSVWIRKNSPFPEKKKKKTLYEGKGRKRQVPLVSRMWKCAWWYLWGDDRIRPQHHSAGKRNWILQYETGDLQNIWPQRQIFFWIVSKTTFRTHFQAKTTLSDWDLCCVTVCWDTFWRNAALFRADRTSLRSSYGMLKAKRLPTADKQTCGPSRGAQNSPRRRLFSWRVWIIQTLAFSSNPAQRQQA